MNQIKLTGLALVLSVTHAFANGEVAPEYWSGTYLGAHFGAGAGTIHQSFTDFSITTSNQSTTKNTSNITASGQRDGSITGSNLDLFVGYNTRLNTSKFIFGGQFEGTLFNNITMKASGERNASTVSQQFSGATLIADTLNNARSISEMSTDLTSLFSLVGRVGVLAKPNTLVYALVGASEGNFILLESFGGSSSSSNSATGNTRNQWNLGWTAGGGVEYKFSEHWSLLAEYRYLYFSYNQKGVLGSDSTTINQITDAVTFTSSSSSGQNTHSKFNFNLGQVGIVYRI